MQQKEEYFDDPPYFLAGYDESNHGLYPEICCMAFGSDSELMQETFHPRFKKIHNPITTLRHSRPELSKAYYNFLILEKLQKERICRNRKSYKLMGIILASLLYQEPLERIVLLGVDGYLSPKEINYTREVVSKSTGLEKGAIVILADKDLDRKTRLVNVADYRARQIFHEYRDKPKQVFQSPNRKILLLDLL